MIQVFDLKILVSHLSEATTMAKNDHNQWSGLPTSLKYPRFNTNGNTSKCATRLIDFQLQMFNFNLRFSYKTMQSNIFCEWKLHNKIDFDTHKKFSDL